MALITCPECNKQVSSIAVSCPNCGYPIAASNPEGKVVIKICNGLAGIVKIFNTSTQQILWTGRAGQIAEFNITESTPIGIIWGLNKLSSKTVKAPTTIKQIVRAGEKYHLTWSKGFFTVDIVLNKVDVIDSE